MASGHAHAAWNSRHACLRVHSPVECDVVHVICMPLDAARLHLRPARRARRLPARLPGHLRAADHGRERPRGRQFAARRTIRRRPACCAPRSRATSIAPIPTSACCIRCGASAARAKAGSSASRGTRRSRRSPRGSRDIAASADGPQAIVPYSYAGTMGLLQYASMDRRFFHRLGASLLDRTICASAGKAGWAAAIGASVGMDVEQFEHSRLIVIWGSNPVTSNLHFWTRAQEAKRRGAKLIAIDPYRSATAEKCHEHIALLPGTDGALALGPHARADRGRPGRPRLHRPLHARLRRELAARAAAVDAGARRADLRHHGGAGHGARARLRHDQARRHPRQLRHAARARAAATRCARSPACRRWSARGAIPRAARCSRRRAPIPVDHARARAARPDPRHAAHDQHVRDRRRAARRARSAGPRDLRLQLESGRGRAGVGEGARGLRARGPVLSSSTRSSRPTPPTSPTSCCRRPRSSSRSTCTRRTATCTRWPTTRRSRRWAKRCPTPRCSAGSPRAWASPSPASATATTTSRGRRGGATDPRAARPRLGRAEARRLAAARPARRPTRRSRKATSRRRRASASSRARRRRRWARTRCPTSLPPRESAATNPELARRYPLAFISPPARNFLNSSFANLPAFVAEEKHAEARSQSATTPPRAASPTATSCASATTAAASRRPRA